MSRSTTIHPVRPGDVVLVYRVDDAGNRSSPTGRVTAVHGPFERPVDGLSRDLVPLIDVKVFDTDGRVREIVNLPNLERWTAGNCCWQNFAEFAIPVEEGRAPAMDAPTQN